MNFNIILGAVIFILSCTTLMVRAAPLDDSKNAQILRYDTDINGSLDGYSFGYETSDGIKRDEKAVLKNAGTDQEAISVTGSISWVAPDGQTYTLNYIADENGFQPQGDHLPHN